MVTWLNTLNNEHLCQNLESQSDFDQERCWKYNKGLRVWDVARQGIPPANSQGIYNGIDVVLITASALQIDPLNYWITKRKWHTVIADEGHDYLRGQHNARAGRLSLTLQNWYCLQHLTKSMFVITGTPFVTKISYDVIAITKAVAIEQIRALWGKEYTDTGLEELIRGWRSEITMMDPASVAQQEKIRTVIKDKLAFFMIRRDENSCIRDKPVMIDYFKQCHVYEDPLMPADNGAELVHRENLYRMHFKDTDSFSKTRNDNMRCLCWSYRFVRWQGLGNRERGTFWRDYTLEEAQRQIRTRELLKILKEGKASGNDVILFVQRVFLAEMCICVSNLTS